MPSARTPPPPQLVRPCSQAENNRIVDVGGKECAGWTCALFGCCHRQGHPEIYIHFVKSWAGFQAALAGISLNLV